MLRLAPGLLCGAYALQQLPILPDGEWRLLSCVVGLAALFSKPLRFAGAVLCGASMFAHAASRSLDDQLQRELDGEQLTFTARIVEFPSRSGAATRLIVSPGDRSALPRRIRLSWYDANAEPRLGDSWQFEARLRRPRGFANPDGFDYEAWLFRQGIGATGYVINAAPAADTSTAGLVDRLRRAVRNRVRDSLPADDATAVLLAVTIGARQDITREQWDRYAATGTSHLMAISGLHVGLAAAAAFLLVRVLAAPLCRRGNAQDAAVLAAALAATGYALVSGFAVPARRAMLMSALLSLALLLHRQLGGARILAIACLVVVLGDPLATLQPGFQLSFLAVAVLLWSMQLSPVPSAAPGGVVARRGQAALRLFALQFALLFGLLPLTALLFGRIAWLAPAVNLLALPVFNLLTVPASLAGACFGGPLQPLGDLLLRLAHASIAAVLQLIAIAAALPYARHDTPPIHGFRLLSLWLPMLWVCLPPGFPGRRLAIVGVLGIVLHTPEPPPHACVDIHVLDVGQGLAVVARTRGSLTVFDAGPAFRSGGDTGTLVVAPFIASLGAARIDTLIVSHADLDHAGGVAALLERYPAARILAGETLDEDLPGKATAFRCAAGETWRHDGVGFRLLHPGVMSPWRGNNASCVLEISAGRARALLTGDIETPVETGLLHAGALRRVDLAVVPHHGSATSSTQSFIEALGADAAIVSAGHANRWGFPKRLVVERWQDAGARVLSTAGSGAISRRLCRDTGAGALREQRRATRRFWHASS